MNSCDVIKQRDKIWRSYFIIDELHVVPWQAQRRLDPQLWKHCRNKGQEGNNKEGHQLLPILPIGNYSSHWTLTRVNSLMWDRLGKLCKTHAPVLPGYTLLNYKIILSTSPFLRCRLSYFNSGTFSMAPSSCGEAHVLPLLCYRRISLYLLPSHPQYLSIKSGFTSLLILLLKFFLWEKAVDPKGQSKV